MKITGNGFAAAAFLTLSIGASDAQIKLPTVFDKPVIIQVVPLPLDANNPLAKKPKRSCYYYPNFMIKEVDLGEKGAEEIAIVRIIRGAKNPPCDKKNAGEIIINGDEWSGYFYGVKGDYVFFNADDGYNGGYPFSVYSGATGKKLFEDSRRPDEFSTVQLLDKGLEMRYRRAFAASCSLFADAKDCWPKVTKAIGIVDASPPDCSKPYKAAMESFPEFSSQTSKSPSMIGYPVLVRFVRGNLTFTALPGPVQCWLPD